MANSQHVDQREARAKRFFERPTLIASALTIPFLVLQNSTGHVVWHTIGLIGNLAAWAVFVAETLTLLCVVGSRRRWLVEHPLDVAIVLLSEPFLFPLVQGLRALRLLQHVRTGPSLKRLFTPSGLRYIAFLALVVLLSSAEAYHLTEHVDYGGSLYWAITTITTVGYGDVTPSDPGGKVVACIVMVVGSVFFAVMTGAVAQQFLSNRADAQNARENELVLSIRQLAAQVERLEQNIAERSAPEPDSR